MNNKDFCSIVQSPIIHFGVVGLRPPPPEYKVNRGYKSTFE